MQLHTSHVTQHINTQHPRASYKRGHRALSSHTLVSLPPAGSQGLRPVKHCWCQNHPPASPTWVKRHIIPDKQTGKWKTFFKRHPVKVAPDTNAPCGGTFWYSWWKLWPEISCPVSSTAAMFRLCSHLKPVLLNDFSVIRTLRSLEEMMSCFASAAACWGYQHNENRAQVHLTTKEAAR